MVCQFTAARTDTPWSCCTGADHGVSVHGGENGVEVVAGSILKTQRSGVSRACPVWVHFHARLVFRVTDRIVLLRVRPTAPSRRPFDPPSPGYFLLSGIRISFSSLPSLVFSSRARRSARFGQRPELRLGSWPPRNHPEIVRQHVPRHLAF